MTQLVGVQVEWDPDTVVGDPGDAMTERIRQLRIGQSIKLPGDVVVRSVSVKHGATGQRRFYVQTPERAALGLTRGHVEQGAVRSAAEAAAVALKAFRKAR